MTAVAEVVPVIAVPAGTPVEGAVAAEASVVVSYSGEVDDAPVVVGEPIVEGSLIKYRIVNKDPKVIVGDRFNQQPMRWGCWTSGSRGADQHEIKLHPDCLCYKAGIRVGDFVLEVNGERITNNFGKASLYGSNVDGRYYPGVLSKAVTFETAKNEEAATCTILVRKGDGTVKPHELPKQEGYNGECNKCAIL